MSWRQCAPCRNTDRVNGHDIDIRPIDVLDDSQTTASEEWLDVFAVVQRELFGDKGSRWTVPEIRAMARSSTKQRIARSAYEDGRHVGSFEIHLFLKDNPELAILFLAVRPEARGRGVGSTLLAEAERLVAGHGRTTIHAETEWAEGRADASESFAARHGYTIGQTVLRSEQALPADRAMLDTVLARPGAEDYAMESYVDVLPESWLDDRATLQQRMSTDAPSDDLDQEEEQWDAERLREQHDRTRAAGRRVVETAARHLPTGRLVGFTQVAVPQAEPTLAYQQDTLVLAEHRGHALGLRLKAANARALMQALPEVASVRTWNAASNEHMLAVNRALGYVIDGYSRAWQKNVAR